ncbi:Fucose 4-O-acetylase [Pseudobutyrivibrio sp. NOR37]|uniref:Acyltransferase family protein n=1 Tax=Pseudobutyrivibrio xylanivorans TaxID=185007 RepID=A0A6M0LIJ3_PSEXY|nr:MULTISPECIES: acyltransferase family protein [Pseudobutyrivibrio]NEX02325.1 acyltransferase family protein [Pseudobutyrivibrio xylanivorans]SFR78149.1 Fucose 4-O-acetylase [Pseudobutyrivibrio sp. NOR37]
MDEKYDSDRKLFLDIAKGIGIIMVVWAHAFGPFTNYISSFHMPFFFFISGMLYKGNKTVREYFLVKIKSLLLPFWIYNLLFYPVFFILFYWKKWEYKVCLKEILEIVTTVGKVPFLGATWFLPALFWVSVLVHCLYRTFSKHKISDFLLLPISVIVVVLGFQITFPYRISRTLICSGFYVMGFIYNKYLMCNVNKVVGGIMTMVMLPISAFWSEHFPGSIADNTYDNKISFMIGAIFATFSFIYLSSVSSMIKKNKIVDAICYLGKNSIHIVIWQFLAFRFTIVLQIIFADAPLSSLTAFPVYDTSGIWFVIYLFMGIVVSLVIGKIMDKFFLNKLKKKITCK